MTDTEAELSGRELLVLILLGLIAGIALTAPRMMRVLGVM